MRLIGLISPIGLIGLISLIGLIGLISLISLIGLICPISLISLISPICLYLPNIHHGDAGTAKLYMLVLEADDVRHCR